MPRLLVFVRWGLIVKCAYDPGHFSDHQLGLHDASACVIMINDFVHSQNEVEKSSIDVLSPRLLITQKPFGCVLRGF